MFDDYLATLPEDDRAALTDVIGQVAALVPSAMEERSYGVAALLYKNKPLPGFRSDKAHLSLFPFQR